VRNKTKIEAELGKEILAKLSKITVGDGTHANLLDEAMSGIDAVLSGRGADPQLAHELAAAVKRNKYPPAKPGGVRLLAPQRGLSAIVKVKTRVCGAVAKGQ